MSQGLDVARLLARLATASPGSDAVVDDHCRVVRAGLQRRVHSAVARLTQLGVPPGARFGVQLGNHVDTLAVYLAGWSRGSTPVNVNRRYRVAEVAALM
ncbi:MAG TPA: AMP-binding protein, partial [Euzebya sp.]|nr:AMP-binding protein [Euzebya sp.]